MFHESIGAVATHANRDTGVTGHVIGERLGNAGRITLNRPQALNALTHEMCLELHARLADWARDDAVKLVIIDGAGERAFCAGGDVRALYADRQAGGDARFGFYRDEYRLNAFIKRYPKPYVALIDGIVMGGGVGVSIHGSHRVATERTLFAMPETGIGLFPDVGGTYFLPRLPGQIGLFLGLTGHRLKAADCLHAGLAEAAVPSARLPDLIDALGGAVNADVITGILQRFAEPPESASLATLRAAIDDCFGESSVERILSELEHHDSEFADAVAANLRQKSPTSLKVTLRQLRAGAHLGFADCMRLEYRLASRFMRAQDFFEGVRAVVIDKDNKPAWQPDSLEAVSEAAVAAYFAPLPEGELTFD